MSQFYSLACESIDIKANNYLPSRTLRKDGGRGDGRKKNFFSLQNMMKWEKK